MGSRYNVCKRTKKKMVRDPGMTNKFCREFWRHLGLKKIEFFTPSKLVAASFLFGCRYWLSVGARPSRPVAILLSLVSHFKQKKMFHSAI